MLGTASKIYHDRKESEKEIPVVCPFIKAMKIWEKLSELTFLELCKLSKSLPSLEH
jgi:hypothetical protein